MKGSFFEHRLCYKTGNPDSGGVLKGADETLSASEWIEKAHEEAMKKMKELKKKFEESQAKAEKDAEKKAKSDAEKGKVEEKATTKEDPEPAPGSMAAQFVADYEAHEGSQKPKNPVSLIDDSSSLEIPIATTTSNISNIEEETPKPKKESPVQATEPIDQISQEPEPSTPVKAKEAQAKPTPKVELLEPKKIREEKPEASTEPLPQVKTAATPVEKPTAEVTPAQKVANPKEKDSITPNADQATQPAKNVDGDPTVNKPVQPKQKSAVTKAKTPPTQDTIPKKPADTITPLKSGNPALLQGEQTANKEPITANPLADLKAHSQDTPQQSRVEKKPTIARIDAVKSSDAVCPDGTTPLFAPTNTPALICSITSLGGKKGLDRPKTIAERAKTKRISRIQELSKIAQRSPPRSLFRKRLETEKDPKVRALMKVQEKNMQSTVGHEKCATDSGFANSDEQFSAVLKETQSPKEAQDPNAVKQVIDRVRKTIVAQKKNTLTTIHTTLANVTDNIAKAQKGLQQLATPPVFNAAVTKTVKKAMQSQWNAKRESIKRTLTVLAEQQKELVQAQAETKAAIQKVEQSDSVVKTHIVMKQTSAATLKKVATEQIRKKLEGKPEAEIQKEVAAAHKSIDHEKLVHATQNTSALDDVFIAAATRRAVFNKRKTEGKPTVLPGSTEYEQEKEDVTEEVRSHYIATNILENEQIQYLSEVNENGESVALKNAEELEPQKANAYSNGYALLHSYFMDSNNDIKNKEVTLSPGEEQDAILQSEEYKNLSVALNLQDKNPQISKDLYGNPYVYLEGGIKIQIPHNPLKKEEKGKYIIQVGDREIGHTNDPSKIEKLTEEDIAGKVIDALKVGSMFKGKEDEILPFVQMCVNNGGSGSINPTGRLQSHKKDYEIFPPNEAIQKVAYFLHVAGGVEFPIAYITGDVPNMKAIQGTNSLSKKSKENLKKINVVGEDGRFNSKGIKPFQLLVKDIANRGGATRFRSQQEYISDLKAQGLIEDNDKNNTTAHIAIGGEKVSFGVEEDGGFFNPKIEKI